jgi:hypothetical protein
MQKWKIKYVKIQKQTDIFLQKIFKYRLELSFFVQVKIGLDLYQNWTLGSLVDVACNFSGKEVRNG